MNYQYNDFHNHARDLEFRVHDLIDNHAHPEAHALREEVRLLKEDFEQGRNPRSIESRMETIQRQLMQNQHSNQPYMDVSHSTDLHRHMQDMRMAIRKFQ